MRRNNGPARWTRLGDFASPRQTEELTVTTDRSVGAATGDINPQGAPADAGRAADMTLCLCNSRFSIFHSSPTASQASPYWLPTPLTRVRTAYSPREAVMNSVCRSRPPKQILPVQFSGTSRCSTCLPVRSKTKTPLPVR